MKHTCARRRCCRRAAARADAPVPPSHRLSARSYLPKDMQDKQTPFAFYVQQELAQVHAERAERAALGTGQPYNRQLP